MVAKIKYQTNYFVKQQIGLFIVKIHGQMGYDT